MPAANGAGLPATFAAALVVALGATTLGAPLGSATATLAACAAMLVTGLPHGTFDLALIHRRPAPGAVGRGAVVAIYLAGAAATAAVWTLEPMGALTVFLAISAFHFAEDWSDAGAWTSVAIAASVLAAPAILHRGDIAGIFVALTGQARAADAATVLLAIVPAAFPVALAGMAILVRRGRPGDAAGAGCAILSTLLLPPAIGFSLYFCLFHSPRHFRAALATLGWGARQWRPVVIPLTLAAIAIVGALFAVRTGEKPSMRLLTATFMGLSVLTVPHMATPAIVRWIEARTGKAPIRAGTIRSR